MNYRAFKSWLLVSILLWALLAPPAAIPAASESPAALALERSLSRVDPQPITTPPADGAIPLELRRKFEPALLKQLLAVQDEPSAASALLRGIVMLHPAGGVDSSSLDALSLDGLDKAARGAAIVHILQSQAQAAQQDVLLIVQEAQQTGQIASFQPLWIVNGIAVQGTREAFLALAARPDVSMIRQDHMRYLDSSSRGACNAQRCPLRPYVFQLDPVQWNVRRVQADRAWESLGLSGDGVVVGIMDSGVDWQHPLLASSYRGYTGKPLAEHAGNWYCATDEGYTYPGDGLGHGTHVTGIVLGQDGIGAAPGTQWIAVKVFNNQGFAYDSWLHAGFEWLLAPNGDPALAPDVVNGSWGSADSASLVFQNDIRALRAAGIVPIFAAGNEGPEDGSVTSPGSLPEAIAIGATDRDDLSAWFSGRGPSPWDEIKPEVSAPGVDILSALPGGGLGLKSGTSMAAPLVAGVVALLLEANPALTVDQIEAILTQTALPLGEGHPNNEYGWGLVDAYAAAVRAGSFGTLDGTARDRATLAPVSGATVEADGHGSGAWGSTLTDADGTFDIGLSAGAFDVTARAFGYQDATIYNVQVVTATTTTLHIDLDALPTGMLQGTVSEVGTGKPLSATVRVPGAPTWAATNPLDGRYALALPQGTRTVRVEAWGYRAVTATVTLVGGDVLVRDFALEAAPTILLVDSGAWYNGSQRQFYERALYDLGYLYDARIIIETGGEGSDIPTAGQLSAYDLVIWSAPQDAPGLIGASKTITTYLSAGGRLLLSGQDVAFWDGGGSGMIWASYLHNYLKTDFIADTAASPVLSGSGIWAGLTITLAGGEGADNQVSPDVIAPADDEFAASILAYEGDGGGGLQVGPCLPYRALVFGFGLEGIDSDAVRRAVLQRSIDWLAAPPQGAGIELKDDGQVRIQPPGAWLTHTVRLRNLGEAGGDTYTVWLDGHTWPSLLLAPGTLSLQACASTTLEILTTIPPGIGWHISDTATLHALSTVSPGLAATVSLTTKTPAPVLLVDGARFYDMSSHYIDALQQSGIDYDYHQIKKGWPLTVPTTDTLSMYPVVVWYTAYDWYEPISAAEDARLRHYLDRGGRLLLSAQDFLYYRHGTPLAETYLGVRDHIEDLAPTQAVGEPGHSIGRGLGPFTLTYPYHNWSDGLIPLPTAQVFLRAETGDPIALTRKSTTWRTAFLSFPFETLDAGAASAVMSRAVGWLGWLGTSMWGGTPGNAHGDDEILMTASLYNDGWTDIVSAHFSATVPTGLSLVLASLPPGLAYDPISRLLSWQGSIAQGEGLKLEFQVRVDDGLPDGTQIAFPAWIGYDDHGITFERPFFLRVNAPDLALSALWAQPDPARPHQVLSCTLTVHNAGTLAAAAMVTSALAARGQFTGTLDSGGVGTGTVISNLLSWSGPVAAGETVTLRYRVALDGVGDYILPLRAWVSDGWGGRRPAEAYLSVVKWRAYFPLIFQSSREP
ncbi:MAG: S8 family serine peptidase [Anaerolineae bacterium]|nr:S8 family serine peptidase [Anaerolineae bacterium]